MSKRSTGTGRSPPSTNVNLFGNVPNVSDNIFTAETQIRNSGHAGSSQDRRVSEHARRQNSQEATPASVADLGRRDSSGSPQSPRSDEESRPAGQGASNPRHTHKRDSRPPSAAGLAIIANSRAQDIPQQHSEDLSNESASNRAAISGVAPARPSSAPPGTPSGRAPASASFGGGDTPILQARDSQRVPARAQSVPAQGNNAGLGQHQIPQNQGIRDLSDPNFMINNIQPIPPMIPRNVSWIAVPKNLYEHLDTLGFDYLLAHHVMPASYDFHIGFAVTYHRQMRVFVRPYGFEPGNYYLMTTGNYFFWRMLKHPVWIGRFQELKSKLFVSSDRRWLLVQQWNRDGVPPVLWRASKLADFRPDRRWVMRMLNQGGAQS